MDLLAYNFELGILKFPTNLCISKLNNTRATTNEP